MLAPHPTERLQKSSEYRKIAQLIQRLYQSGVIRMGAGWCISMSDMIYTLLKQQGIESRLVECQMIMIKTDRDGGIHPITVGLSSNIMQEGLADTHLVVVTVTDPPMIIDASIGHLLDIDTAVILAECLSEPRLDRVFAEFKTETSEGGLALTYQEKLKQTVPISHQTSVIDRIITDQRIFDSIRTLKVLNYIGISLSMFAVVNVLGKMLGVL